MRGTWVGGKVHWSLVTLFNVSTSGTMKAHKKIGLQLTKCAGKGSLACPSKGQIIEAKVFDNNGQDQGTILIIIEVKRLFGTGSTGRSFLCDLITDIHDYY